jgi:hypothetical protein
VADWKNIMHRLPVYTAQRLGFPDKNPEATNAARRSFMPTVENAFAVLHGLRTERTSTGFDAIGREVGSTGKTPYFATYVLSI